MIIKEPQIYQLELDHTKHNFDMIKYECRNVRRPLAGKPGKGTQHTDIRRRTEPVRSPGTGAHTLLPVSAVPP